MHSNVHIHGWRVARHGWKQIQYLPKWADHQGWSWEGLSWIAFSDSVFEYSNALFCRRQKKRWCLYCVSLVFCDLFCLGFCFVLILFLPLVAWWLALSFQMEPDENKSSYWVSGQDGENKAGYQIYQCLYEEQQLGEDCKTNLCSAYACVHHISLDTIFKDSPCLGPYFSKSCSYSDICEGDRRVYPHYLYCYHNSTGRLWISHLHRGLAVLWAKLFALSEHL